MSEAKLKIRNLKKKNFSFHPEEEEETMLKVEKGQVLRILQVNLNILKDFLKIFFIKSSFRLQDFLAFFLQQ